MLLHKYPKHLLLPVLVLYMKVDCNGVTIAFDFLLPKF